MFDVMIQVAEDAATKASRRIFLRKLGQRAAVVTAGIGAMLLSAHPVLAGKSGDQLYLCEYDDGQTICANRCKGTLTYRDRLSKKRIKITLVSKTPIDACP